MEPAQTVNEVYYLNQIIELKNEIIKLQKELLEKDKIINEDKERIHELELLLQTKQIEKKNNSTNNNTPNITPNPIITPGDINILEKEAIFKIDDLKNPYYTIYILQDGRIAAGGYSTSIIIYNKETFKSEMTIKEHSGSWISYLTQLKNGNLVSLGNDAYINIYCLLDNFKYLVLQKIKSHSDTVYKLREFENERFMTCSSDCTIKFFFKNKNEYIEDYTFKDDINIYNILRTKEGEIVYAGYQYNSLFKTSTYFITFYDLKSRKKIDSTNITDFCTGHLDILYMLSKIYLLVGAKSSILIFDINQHRQIKEIKLDNSDYITSFLKIDESTLLSVDNNGKIRQWIINDDNLILECVKEKAHEGCIYMIRRNQDGLLITCSSDNSIKVWA